MINIFKEKINIYSDNLQSAIIKKSNNKSLSGKSLQKLESIINTQYDFKNGEVKLIFGNISDTTNVNTNGITKLIKDIQNIKSIKDDSFIKSQVTLWEVNAKKQLVIYSEPKEQRQLLGHGSRGFVYKLGNSVVKKNKGLSPNETFHEMNICNQYYIKQGSSTNVANIDCNGIKMPFINGKTPNYEETLTGVKCLFKDGFLMGDAKPTNFLITDIGRVVPVDFGLVFRCNNLECLDDEVKKSIVTDYIKGGFRYIPSEIKKEYNFNITKLNDFLGKNSPTRKMNTKILSKAGF